MSEKFRTTTEDANLDTGVTLAWLRHIVEVQHVETQAVPRRTVERETNGRHLLRSHNNSVFFADNTLSTGILKLASGRTSIPLTAIDTTIQMLTESMMSSNQLFMFWANALILREEHNTLSDTNAEGNLNAEELQCLQDTDATEAILA